MDLSRFEALTLIAAVLGAAVLGSGPAGLATAGDFAILLALFAFDGASARSTAGSIAFGGAAGFCALTPVLALAKVVLGASPDTGNFWFLPGAWLVATLILFAVDRFRMSGREDVTLGAAGLGGVAVKPIVSSAPISTYKPARIRVEPVAAPVYTPPAPAPVPAFVTEAPIMVEDFTATTFSAPVVQPTVPVAAPRVPDVTAIPPGREAVIYLNLVGEGLNVLRTVRAENLGRDYYRIADIMPEGEQWEFTPGQVVKCRKKALSNGKHMVAYEEAPRAQ